MEYVEDHTKTYTFTVELKDNKRVFKIKMWANTLWKLHEQIQNQYPNAKIISILGG